MASGGADDCIHLFDLKADRDLGFLTNPGDGSITSLQFFTPQRRYAPSHLLAGCADGSISIWRAGGGWEHLKSLRGHRREVTALAVHPSGRLALSTSRDGTFKMWDMVKGRCTFTTKLEAEAEGVAFAPGGGSYALLTGLQVSLRGVAGAEAAEVRALVHPRRVLCAEFAGDGIIVTGSEDGSVRVWDNATCQEILCISKAHATRIKALALPYAASNSPAGGVAQMPELLASASSDGVVKVWALRRAAEAAAQRGSAAAEGGSDADCVCQVATRARLTVMVAVDPVEVMVERLKQQAEAKKQEHRQKSKAKKLQPAEDATGSRAAVQQRLDKGKRASEAGKASQRREPARGEARMQGAAKAAPAAEPGGVVKGGVVSFMDEQDAVRQRKKSKQVQLNAKRVGSSRAAKKKRAQPVGAATGT